MPTKPSLYCRFVDDILVDVKDIDSLHHLKNRLEERSGLHFTTELNNKGKISFLDVSIDASSSAYTTTVHRKHTDAGRCLNGTSVCPERYKVSVIRAYLHRALKHCSSWHLFNRELRHIRQLLSNNGYSVSMIDSVVNETVSAYVSRQSTAAKPTTDTTLTHALYYKNQMSPAYKNDERALKAIIRRNISVINPREALKLIIYYQNPSTKSLVLRNNMSNDPSMLKKSNVVYHYTCKKGDCALHNNSGYIGHTTTTLSRRITMHLQQGGLKTHNDTHHQNDRLTREDITSNIRILQQESNRRRLHILEAVYIRKFEPSINRQINARGILQLFEGSPP